VGASRFDEGRTTAGGRLVLEMIGVLEGVTTPRRADQASLM
jgi:hypothetical protein